MSKLKWPRRIIQTAQGEQRAIAPLIVSASRATDIPAFFADWFQRRLKEGYVAWVNPFNRQVQYVSLAQARVFVFWTKNAEPFSPVLDQLDRQGLGYYFQYTVNDYGREGYEPGVPSLGRRLESFSRLAERLGPDKVIWRFDPLLLTDELTVDELLARIQAIGARLHPYTRKLVISLADIASYRRVERRFRQAGIKWRPFDRADINRLCTGLLALSDQWKLQIATCCELEEFREAGIGPNACIDPALIARLFGHDPAIQAILPRFCQTELFEEGCPAAAADWKDPGQRPGCGCMLAKDIGSYDTCRHGCVYCYADHGLLRRS